MKRYLILTVFILSLISVPNAFSQIDKSAVYDSLTTIDPDIRQYFPRWKVCEYDLQIQVYQTFLTLGYNKEDLDMQAIEVLAAPRAYDYMPFEILMLSCGKSSIGGVEIESNIGSLLVGFLSGEYYYSGNKRGEAKEDLAYRDYCYSDIPISFPLTNDQTAAITDYLRPTNVNHAMTVSLFEQSLKFGETGFWIRSLIGNDQLGYPFWYAGESKVILQKPLYLNYNEDSRARIPFLIDAYVGGAYRISGGLNEGTSVLEWIPSRKLNCDNGGKITAGLDFHVPVLPEAGVALNANIPMSSLKTYGIENSAYSTYETREDVDFYETDTLYGNTRIEAIAPVLRGNIQFTAFYHWWMDPSQPENYFRFDFGINYWEVTELAKYTISTPTGNETYLTPFATNLKTDKPSEFGDWVYAKIEYRNQKAYPFGLSAQYSNQIFLGRIYAPIFGTWFYIEAKYSTPLRGLNPWESRHFFVISPVLRLTI